MQRYALILMLPLLWPLSASAYTLSDSTVYTTETGGFRLPFEWPDDAIPGTGAHYLWCIKIIDDSDLSGTEPDAIRITSNDDMTVRPYWVQSWVDAGGVVNAIIWSEGPLTDGGADGGYLYASTDTGIADGDDAAALCAAIGAVAFYPCYEGAGSTLHDISGNSNDLSLTDPSWTTGPTGGAIAFSGSSTYGYKDEPTNTDITGSVTVMTWVNYTNASTNRGIFKQQVGGEDESTNVLWQTYIQNSSGKLSAFWEYGNGSNVSSIGPTVASGSFALLTMRRVTEATSTVSFFVNTTKGTDDTGLTNPSGGQVGDLYWGRNFDTTEYMLGSMGLTILIDGAWSDDAIVWAANTQSAADGLIDWSAKESESEGGGGGNPWYYYRQLSTSLVKASR
jgi:hypothetical protein